MAHITQLACRFFSFTKYGWIFSY